MAVRTFLMILAILVVAGGITFGVMVGAHATTATHHPSQCPPGNPYCTALVAGH